MDEPDDPSTYNVDPKHDMRTDFIDHENINDNEEYFRGPDEFNYCKS